METNISTGASWEAEFNGRLQAFAKTTGITIEKVKEVLSSLGVDGTTEQSLTIIDSDEFLPINDLFEAFVDSGLTKKALLRAAMPHLRGKTYLGKTEDFSVSNLLKDIVESSRPLTSLTDEQLLDKYDSYDTEVLRILRERTHGRNCIVFNQDGTVNKTVSLELVKIAKKQQTPSSYPVNGKLVIVRRAGHIPSSPLEESPFFSGEALVNGYCEKSGTIWNEISQENRIFVRVLTAEIHCSKFDYKRIWKDAKSMTLDQLKEEYPEAALQYEEMQANDTLPKLKIIPNSSTNVTKLDNGFKM